MKSLAFLAAVLLVTQAAIVPPEVTHHITILVPSTVLAGPLMTSTLKPHEKEVPAQVQKVDRKQKWIMPVVVNPQENLMTTEQPKVVTLNPNKPYALKRLTRAFPFNNVDKQKPQLTNEVNKIKEILMQRKPNTPISKLHKRSMRSLKEATKTEAPALNTTETVTQNPVIKSLDAPNSTIDPCDLLCTKFEFDPICATNGLCLHEFPNQCILETYNCKHSKGKFSATKEDKCQMHWLAKCEESDMF